MAQDRLLELLRCPRCGAPLRARDQPDDQLVHCERGHAFSTERGFLDLEPGGGVDDTTARTFESFGYEWNAFDEVRDEDAQFAEVYFRDVDLTALAGKTGLDAGCGKGRYTRFVAPHLGALVALDGSSAVVAAAKNLAGFDNVLVIKADLRTASLVEGSMDFITCLGVLHHLEDPRAGFTRLVELLAPGGSMLLYLYSRPTSMGARRLALAAAASLRRLTVKLPHRVLRVVSAPIAWLLFFGVVQVGAAGARAGIDPLARLPMASYRGKPLRSLTLDTFDRLSAPVEYRYTWTELAPWFEGAGLVVEAAREQAGWFVVVRKPVPAEPGMDGDIVINDDEKSRGSP